jgi:folate-binding protein YgfZ
MDAVVGLVDRSERGKLLLTGPEAASLLNGQVTNEVEALAPGEGAFAAYLTPKGKMLGDLRVLRTEEGIHLDCERVALQALFDLLRRGAIGWQAELHKRTVQEGLLSLLGPGARALVGAEDLPEVEGANADAELDGIAVRLVATDLGVDLLCAAEDTDALRAALLRCGAEAWDEAAAETLRVESGRPRYGVDLDDSVIPQEAGLNDRAVSFTKGCYVGQETVARLRWKGKPNRHLRGLRLDGPAPAGAELRLEGKVVGALSSPVESPRLGPIGLALVRREAEPGAQVDVVAPDGTTARAEVVALPFAP